MISRYQPFFGGPLGEAAAGAPAEAPAEAPATGVTDGRCRVPADGSGAGALLPFGAAVAVGLDVAAPCFCDDDPGDDLLEGGSLATLGREPDTEEDGLAGLCGLEAAAAIPSLRCVFAAGFESSSSALRLVVCGLIVAAGVPSP